MNVVIADDEEHVRRGIELAVDWERFGIARRYHAEDGIQALELIRKHKPAILFCDMSMPRMDGEVLLRSLREEGFRTQVIVVSGYEEFRYARAALQVNGVDYILKPFKSKDLEAAVDKAVQAYHAQESKLRDDYESRHRLAVADSLIEERKLVAYLKGDVAYSDDVLRRLFQKIGLPLQGLHVTCVLPKNKDRLIEQKFSGDIGLFQFAVNNIAAEIMNSTGSNYLCPMEDYQWALISSPAHPEKFKNEYGWHLDKLIRAWQDTIGLEVMHGSAGGAVDYNRLVQAITESKAALLKRELLRTGVPSVAEELPRLADREIPILNAIRKGNKPALAEIIESFVRSLERRGALRLEQLQEFTLEANLMLRRAASFCHTNIERVDWLMPLWISELKVWQIEFQHRCWEMADTCDNDHTVQNNIESVRRYIEQHYQENITLSSLSDKFHFSPRYLAKMFKEQYRMTIITYLTDLRIEKAKAMLEHSDLSIAEVAHLIGYEDENYFGKVFKKQTGVSPLQHRKKSRSR